MATARTLLALRNAVGDLLRDRPLVHFGTTEANDAINDATRRLWEDVLELEPSYLDVTTTLYTWPVNQLSASLAIVLGSSDVFLYLVRRTPTIAAVSYSNLPVPLPRISFEDLHQHPFSSDEQFLVEGSLPGWGGAYAAPAWARQGDAIYMDPPPSTAMQVQFVYIAPPITVSGDGTAVVPASLVSRERMVIYDAALQMIGKDRYAPDTWAERWVLEHRRMADWLAKWKADGPGAQYVKLF